MYQVSQRYINKVMNDRSQVIQWYGDVRLPGPEGDGGIYYNFTNSDIKQGSSKWIRQCCSGDKLEFGTTYASELDLSLYLIENNGNYYLDGKIVDRYMFFGARVRLYFRLFFDDNTYEDVECGIFFVSNAERTSNVLSLTCFDAMTKFNKPMGASITGAAYDWLLAACNACGVTLGCTRQQIEALPNGSINIYIYPALQVDTWRNLIGYVGIVLGANLYIDRDGFLNVKQYSMSACRSISTGWRYSSKITDYECFYSDLVLHYVPADTAETYSTQSAGDGLTYNVGKSPFCQITDTASRQQFMQNIINSIGLIEYTPLEIKCPCDPSFDLMDAIELSGNQAIQGKLSGLCYIEISLGGSQTIRCTGENPYLQAAQSKIDAQIEGLDSKTSGDAIYYYDYTNIQDINLAAGDSRDIIEFEFVTTKRTHLDFHAQILLQLGESVSEPVWLLLTYYLNGAEIREFHPAEHFARADPESRHMLSLMYAFAMPGGQQSSFKVKLQIYGSSLTIPQYNINAWLAGSGLADEEEGGDERIWNNSQIEVQEITITENGTYIAPEKTAYSPVIVNVEGGGGGDKESYYPWTDITPSGWTGPGQYGVINQHCLHNEKLYVFGVNASTYISGQLYRLDGDSWTQLGLAFFDNLNYMYAPANLVSFKGKLWVFGSSGGGTARYSSAYAYYDTSEEKWIKAGLITVNGDFYCPTNRCIFEYNNELHFLGTRILNSPNVEHGTSQSASTRELIHLVFNGNSWRKESDTPINCSVATPFMFDGTQYIAGILNEQIYQAYGQSYYSDIYTYSNGTFTKVYETVASIVEGTAVLYDNEIHLMINDGYSSKYEQLIFNGACFRYDEAIPNYSGIAQDIKIYIENLKLKYIFAGNASRAKMYYTEKTEIPTP